MDKINRRIEFLKISVPEKFCDIDQIFSEKLKGMWMIMFNWLTDIDDVSLAIVIQHVIFW